MERRRKTEMARMSVGKLDRIHHQDCAEDGSSKGQFVNVFVRHASFKAVQNRFLSTESSVSESVCARGRM